MENTPGPRNRKERRAQAKQSSANEVPLSQPSRSAPEGKTLLDIAAERQLLSKESSSSPRITTTKINPDGSLSSEKSDSHAESEPTPYLDIGLYTITLTLLHLTFTVLTHNQYASTPPSLPSLLYKSTIASPTPLLLLMLVGTLHPRAGHPLVQGLFALISMVCGMWLVHTTNRDAYLATMQKAPPLGTLWVWSVVELKWEIAAVFLAIVAAWGWWCGYGIT